MSEIAWLTRKAKDVPTPNVVFLSASEMRDNALGTYWTHEWRHHWQTYNIKPQRPQVFDTRLGHRDAIVKYFSESPKEADALRYELAIAPCEINRERASWM